MILQQIISQNNTSDFQGLKENGGYTVDVNVDFVENFLFLTPYLASDFPEVTCDKTYFFLYSSDHDAPTGAFYGRCCWAKGDNLDLSDFEPLGVIKEGLQAETPFLLRIGTTLYFYYHVVFDRGISPNNEQETRCQTTTGGLLHTATWTDATPINVLGVDLPQDHTGYLKIWNVDGTLKGTHYKQQSLVSFITGEVQASSTENGIDWVRGNIIDLDTASDSDRFHFPSYGDYFKLFGVWFWIGTDQAKTGSNLTSPTRGLVLCKSNTSLDLTEQIMRLDGGVYAVESWHGRSFKNEKIIHLYACNINLGTVKYYTLDLEFLENQI